MRAGMFLVDYFLVGFQGAFNRQIVAEQSRAFA